MCDGASHILQQYYESCQHHSQGKLLLHLQRFAFDKCFIEHRKDILTPQLHHCVYFHLLLQTVYLEMLGANQHIHDLKDLWLHLRYLTWEAGRHRFWAALLGRWLLNS